jgi:Protein-tyrosine-phosphatase
METNDAAELLAALGHESRLAVFRLLVEAGPSGLHAGAISERLGLPPATLSFHLAHLSRVCLIHGRQESRFIFYSTDYTTMDKLLTFLTKNCCQGQPCLPKTAMTDTTSKHSPDDGTPVKKQPVFPMTSKNNLEFTMQKRTVLVLCTGNSCRSQMGEAILNHDLAGHILAISAGTVPQPKVADGAIEALKLAGLSVEGLHPKLVDQFLNEPIHLVVSVCDNAKETCPVFPSPVQHIHVPFHDPHGEPLESFIAVRDDIRNRLVTAVRDALAL